MRLTEPQYSKATPATLSGASEIDAYRDVTARQFGKGSCVRVKGGLQRAALARATLPSPPDLNELSRHARQVPSNSEWLG